MGNLRDRARKYCLHVGKGVFPMSQPLPDHLLKKLQSCRSLPSAPAVVMEVLDLAQDPDIGTAKLAKVIARDPALVAKILKVSNSAWCGVLREVTTLDQAVSLLGLNGTMSLALSFSLVRVMGNASGVAFDHQLYWRRSVISASATLSVGTCIRAATRDELFLAGLLQDIGMLVLTQVFPEYGRMIASAKGDHDRVIEIECKELGADHAQVGSWFLNKWGLPTQLVEGVRDSHLSEGIEKPLSKAIAIGSRIADIWFNPDTAAASEATSKIFTSLLSLTTDRLDQILVKTAADLPEITDSLDIGVGDEHTISRLLDEAREAIEEINLRTLLEVRNLAVQAQRDSLTSLFNRTYLNQILTDLFEKSRNLAQPLTLIFIDIDKFKSINDTCGHQGGDAVLISVARTIKSATRDYDIVVRYGGDEFVVLLVNSGEMIGAEIAERIHSMVEKQLHHAGDGNILRVTVSIGWVTMSSGSNIKTSNELLEAADAKLYSAKAAGRNRVAQAY
jgi:diguanylate cyclase (GGDEF)-like protein